MLPLTTLIGLLPPPTLFTTPHPKDHYTTTSPLSLHNLLAVSFPLSLLSLLSLFLSPTPCTPASSRIHLLLSLSSFLLLSVILTYLLLSVLLKPLRDDEKVGGWRKTTFLILLWVAWGFVFVGIGALVGGVGVLVCEASGAEKGWGKGLAILGAVLIGVLVVGILVLSVATNSPSYSSQSSLVRRVRKHEEVLEVEEARTIPRIVVSSPSVANTGELQQQQYQPQQERQGERGENDAWPLPASNSYPENGNGSRNETETKPKDINKYIRMFLLLLSILQLAILISLLVFTCMVISRGEISEDCVSHQRASGGLGGSWSKSNPLPVRVVEVGNEVLMNVDVVSCGASCFGGNGTVASGTVTVVKTVTEVQNQSQSQSQSQETGGAGRAGVATVVVDVNTTTTVIVTASASASAL